MTLALNGCSVHACVLAVCLLEFTAVTKVSRATVSKYSEVSLVCSPVPSRVPLSEMQLHKANAEVQRAEAAEDICFSTGIIPILS